MKSSVAKSLAPALLVCFAGMFMLAGCGGTDGKDASTANKESGLDQLKKPDTRPPEETIAFQWERFSQADEEREQRRAIVGIGRVGAPAESELAKLQEIANDDQNYGEKVRQAAEQAIKNINTAIEQAAE